jgi:hypothetical protein
MTTRAVKGRLAGPMVRKRATRSGLVEVLLAEGEHRQRPPSVFVVRCGGGRSVEVPADFDEVALRRLLSVLGAC